MTKRWQSCHFLQDWFITPDRIHPHNIFDISEVCQGKKQHFLCVHGHICLKTLGVLCRRLGYFLMTKTSVDLLGTESTASPVLIRTKQYSIFISQAQKFPLCCFPCQHPLRLDS